MVDELEYVPFPLFGGYFVRNRWREKKFFGREASLLTYMPGDHQDPGSRLIALSSQQALG